MPFVTTHPEALTYAASSLNSLGTAMAAQNAAAAAPTTAIVPAAADPVSALQAAQFDAYGQLYQSVSAQATAIHQMLVDTLDANAGSYGETEAANQTATGSMSLPGLSGSLAGGSGATAAAALPAAGSTAGTSGGAAVFAINGVQNFTSAASDLISQATIATIPGFGLGAGGATAGASGLASAPASVVSNLAGAGATSVSAGLSQASSVGELSVPPSWTAGQSVPVAATPATLTGAGVTNAAPHTPSATTMPAGLPSTASAGKGVGAFGAPRYGVKPTVMPKPTVV